MSEILHQARSLLNSHGRDYAESPLPAWAFSAAILSQLPLARKHNAKLFPRPWTLLLFSSTMALGGWMTYDHAPIDGAGTTAAWSFLYLMVNGVRKSVKQLVRLRNPLPLGIAGFAAVNAITHGNYYFNTSRPKEEKSS
ncbi:hypothetical protein DFP73DRAFT_567771 [Morchella snyderi]|nr:hypothetical protein DFP73DRAFT_567771 [Morchella snyderi]